MNPPNHPTETMQRARRLYREFGAYVDPIMAQRLRHARRRALDTGHARKLWMRRLVPASTLALALAAVLMFWQPLRQGTHVPAQPGIDGTATSILPPDAEQADPGLYRNLDFYAWLAQQPAPHEHP